MKIQSVALSAFLFQSRRTDNKSNSCEEEKKCKIPKDCFSALFFQWELGVRCECRRCEDAPPSVSCTTAEQSIKHHCVLRTLNPNRAGVTHLVSATTLSSKRKGRGFFFCAAGLLLDEVCRTAVGRKTIISAQSEAFRTPKNGNRTTRRWHVSVGAIPERGWAKTRRGGRRQRASPGLLFFVAGI